MYSNCGLSYELYGKKIHVCWSGLPDEIRIILIKGMFKFLNGPFDKKCDRIDLLMDELHIVRQSNWDNSGPENFQLSMDRHYRKIGLTSMAESSFETLVQIWLTLLDQPILGQASNQINHLISYLNSMAVSSNQNDNDYCLSCQGSVPINIVQKPRRRK